MLIRPPTPHTPGGFNKHYNPVWYARPDKQRRKAMLPILHVQTTLVWFNFFI